MTEAMGGGPYRERPPLLLCPRCGEVLEEVFSGVNACLRCNGIWIAQPTIETAFGTPRWPMGVNSWWKRELDCPACACEGTKNEMAAVMVGNTFVDRCAGHGVWLDEGELGRLLGSGGADELAALYQRVIPEGASPERLVRRKAELSALRAEELERRRREAAAREARAAELDKEREQREAQLMAMRAEELRRRDGARHEEVVRAAHAKHEQRLALQEQVAKQRALVAEAEQRLTALRGELEMAEDQLAAYRLKAKFLTDQLAELE